MSKIIELFFTTFSTFMHTVCTQWVKGNYLAPDPISDLGAWYIVKVFLVVRFRFNMQVNANKLQQHLKVAQTDWLDRWT